MVQIKAFSYNPNAKYQPSGVYKTKDPGIINQTIEAKQPSDASGSSVQAKFPDVFDKNMLPYVKVTPSFVPGIILRCDSGTTRLNWKWWPWYYFQLYHRHTVSATQGLFIWCSPNVIHRIQQRKASYRLHLSAASQCVVIAHTRQVKRFYKTRRWAYQWINPHILLGNPWFSISD